MGQTIYDHLGGAEALHRFVETFYRSVLVDDVLGPVFHGGSPEHIPHLVAFDAEAFGGPERYTREFGGFSTIIDAHRHLEITERQRERFVELYLAAAAEAGLPDDPRFLATLRSHVEFGSQVAVQNSHARTEDELHPLREVPKWSWEKPAE